MYWAVLGRVNSYLSVYSAIFGMVTNEQPNEQPGEPSASLLLISVRRQSFAISRLWDASCIFRQDIMEERLTCLEEKLSSIQLSLEMLPDLLSRCRHHCDHAGDDYDAGGGYNEDADHDDFLESLNPHSHHSHHSKGVFGTNSGKEEVGGEGSCFLKYKHHRHRHHSTEIIITPPR